MGNALPKHIQMQIKQAYEDFPHAEKTIPDIAKEYKLKKSFIYNQVMGMGLATRMNKKPQKRTSKEQEIILKNCDKRDTAIRLILSKYGYTWSVSEIQSYRQRRRWSFKTGNYLTVSQLAEGLGVGEGSIKRAIGAGKLKAEFMEKQNGPFHIYKIKYKDAKRYIVDNIVNINLRYVDKYFL